MVGAAQARLRAEVFSELTTMVKAGVTIGQSLTAIGEDLEHARMSAVLTEMGMQVSSGETLTDAMRRHPDLFSPVTVSMVEVGEKGGRLEHALRTAADYHEHDFELRHLLTRETAYPIVLFAIIIFIMPIANFIKTWIAGPGLLAALIGLVLQLIFIAVSVGVPVAAVVLLVKRYSGSEQGALALDGAKLKIPLVGNVIRKLCLARACRALASLYSSGVLMGTSLRLAGEAAGNRAVARELTRNVAKVEGGGKLSEALGESPLIPRMVVRMLSTGEDTGEIDKMAHNVADHFEEEAQTAIKQMAVSITPVAVLIAGVIVAIMAIGFYTGGYVRLLGID
jgi:type IV pilus assembly protein PilC